MGAVTRPQRDIARVAPCVKIVIVIFYARSHFSMGRARAKQLCRLTSAAVDRVAVAMQKIQRSQT
jgi:D-alanyl-D-alanine dipeptidase